MASRENQGLHITLILLVMLTVVLCLTSYVFYSKAETRRSEAEDARNRLTTAQADLQRAGFKVQTLTYMINGGGRTWAQIAEDLENIPGAATDDPTLAVIRKNYQDNMMLYGAADAEHESARNYESLPAFLLARIRDLNQQLTDLRRNENQLTAQTNALEQSSAERTQQFEQAQQQARDDLAAEREKFTTALAEVRQQMADTAERLTAKDTRIVELTAELEEARAEYEKRVVEFERTILDQKNLITGIQRETFDVPDAMVKSVNARERVLYIDVGWGDNLREQQTFSVFDKGTSGIMQARPKGRITVMQVVDEHLAMCRIEEDSLTNIIVPGDVVFTPAWEPGRPLRFAVAGLIDITGNNKSDLDLLKSLIDINGGVLDDEVTVQTRFLIQGENRAEGPEGVLTSEQQAEFERKVMTATQIGVSRLSVDRLLSLMGWRADMETVRIGTGVGEIEIDRQEKEPGATSENGAAFRPRTPPRGTNGAF
jgi:hypothetical protein